jgi:TorA maturation chaperone TorD
MVLVRPDDHIATIAPMKSNLAESAYNAALSPLQRQAVSA